MKQITLVAAMLAIFMTANAQLDTTGPKVAVEAPAQEEETYTPEELKAITDSINASFTYKTGQVTLSNGVVLQVPKGFRYLDVVQSHRVLEEVWGNPKSETMGMIFPEHAGPMDEAGWAFNIQFEEMGYVKDEDADKIKYDELLEQMKKETAEASVERVKEGFPSIDLIGWAATPFYDKANKTLHWAKEIRFGSENGEHTLNYNVRVLGRKGVLSMNAIGVMSQLPEIKQHIPAILKSASFEDGHAYADFDPKVDEVAAWTIGGLVAGKVLMKAGFFAVIAKFGKFIIMGLIAFGGVAYKYITGRRRKEEEVHPEPLPVAGEGDEPGADQKS